MQLRFALFVPALVAIGFSCAQEAGVGGGGGYGGYGGSSGPGPATGGQGVGVTTATGGATTGGTTTVTTGTTTGTTSSTTGATTTGATTTGATTTGATTTGATTTGATTTGATTTTVGATTGGGAGGVGGQGGAVTTGGQGGAVNGATTAGTGGMCAQSPCELVAPQCGCPGGQQCSVDPVTNVIECIPQGTVLVGQACGAGMQCAPGLLCLQDSPTVSTCAAFCTTNAQCVAPGGICILTLDNGMDGGVPGVTLCSQNCDPINNSGCVAGLSCQLEQEVAPPMSLFTVCGAPGLGKKGAACATDADCAADFGCFNNGVKNVCARYCDANAQNCPGFQLCYGLVDANQNPIMLGATSLGICQ